jgi:hypothetical protein
VSGGDPYPCPECPETFTSLRSRASHLKVHNNSVNCPICHKPQRYLGPHIQKVHKDDPLVALELGITALVEEVRHLRAENRELRKINNPA